MKQIVLQETSQDVLDVLNIALETGGFTALSILDCANILAKIEEALPHVVMLDFKLKGENCIDACRAIKARYPYLPVIALSCNSNINDEYSRHGFDDYISKPFDLDHLYATLRKYIPVMAYSKESRADYGAMQDALIPVNAHGSWIFAFF